MYYLQSRYYDPMVGRFINADDVAFIGASGTILSENLFSYCENNPVNYSDPSGYWRFQISVDAAALILDFFITCVLPYILTAFKATRLLKITKATKWFRSKYDVAVKGLAKAIYNAMDSILYNIAGKAANAATRAFTLAKITNLIDGLFNFSIGYAIASIIDRLDRDGKSGTICF